MLELRTFNSNDDILFFLQFLETVLRNSHVDILSDFHRHCFTSMLQETGKGLSVHGYALFIQVIKELGYLINLQVQGVN